MFSKFFIERPIFANVIAIMTMIVGGVALVAGVLANLSAAFLAIDMAVATLLVYLEPAFFKKSGIEEGNVGWNLDDIVANDARWNQRILSVCAIVEDQIFAKVLVALRAKEALITRSRIGSDHSHAARKSILHGSSSLFNDAG